MQRAMIFLTVNAAISDEFAGALFEFDVINFRFATGSTAHHHVGGLPLFAMNRCTHNYLSNNIIIRPSSVGTTNNKNNSSADYVASPVLPFFFLKATEPAIL
jgi:hypothetical protein